MATMQRYRTARTAKPLNICCEHMPPEVSE